MIGNNRIRRFLEKLREVASEAGKSCLRYRVAGLAAESAFFALLSLPPIVFALVGAIGFIASRTSPETIVGLRNEILDAAGQFLTPAGIDTILAPTVDEVLTSRRGDVVSIGFLIALWTGSRTIAVFLETVSLMYGYHGKRGIVHQRALSVILFLLLLIIGVILLPMILTGPDVVAAVVPDRLDPLISRLYWPVVGLAALGLVTSMFYLAVPQRHRWASHLPGAIWTIGMWLVGSQILRAVLALASGSTSIYGPLAAPIAVMLWLYLTSLVMLIGAAINAAVAQVFPDFAGLPVGPNPDGAHSEK